MSVDDGVDVCTECYGYHCSDLICGNCLKEKISKIREEVEKLQECFHIEVQIGMISRNDVLKIINKEMK